MKVLSSQYIYIYNYIYLYSYLFSFIQNAHVEKIVIKI